MTSRCPGLYDAPASLTRATSRDTISLRRMQVSEERNTDEWTHHSTATGHPRPGLHPAHYPRPDREPQRVPGPAGGARLLPGGLEPGLRRPDGALQRGLA